MRNKSLGRTCDPKFVQRTAFRFQIGPNTNPNKVQRWLNRGQIVIDPAKLAKIAARHVHPAHKRAGAY